MLLSSSTAARSSSPMRRANSPEEAEVNRQPVADYRFYAGGRHEILNEAEKDRVHRDVGHWLRQILDR